MKNIPQSVVNELKKLKLMDESPWTFTAHKINFCEKLYSIKYRELSKWDIHGIMERHSELIDYTFLTEVQFDFLQEQYTFALESL